MRRNLALAAISGLLLAAAMPMPGVWAASWFGLVPLLVAIRGARARDAALFGLICGLVYYGMFIFWLSLLGYASWALLVLLQTAFMVLFAASACPLMRVRSVLLRCLAVPAAWTAMQWMRGLGIFGFNLGSFAHTQANNLPVAQLGSITGPWGVDFLLCLVSVALVDALFPEPDKRNLAPAAAALAVSIVVVAGGWLALRRTPDYLPKTKVAIIQGSIIGKDHRALQDSRKCLFAYEQMSRAAAADKPDFIIWPETVIPSRVWDNRLGLLFSQLAATTHTNYLVGAYDLPEDPYRPEGYNSAFFYDRQGKKLGVYHKVHLVPFGEYVPWREQMPWLGFLSFRKVDVLADESHQLVKTEIGKVGTSICFESMFAGIAREETLRGAEVLVVITNDSWFNRTRFARQHLMVSRLRAIENRRYVVQSSTTGISGIIDPYGRIVSELGIYKRGIVTGKIAALHTITPYMRFGDWLAYACTAFALVMLWVRRREQSLQAETRGGAPTKNKHSGSQKSG